MIKQLDYNPVACPRPIVGKWGTYYPKKYTQFKKDVSWLLSGMKEARIIVLLFVLKRPKRLKNGDRVLHTKRPDLDNLIKSILDCLPYDDSVIHTLFAQKVYASSDEKPKIIIIGGKTHFQGIIAFFRLLMAYLIRVF